MERAKYNYLIQIIKDYPKTPQYIHDREDEILHPWREQDENIGGGRPSPSNGQERLLIRLSDDRRLHAIQQQYDAVTRCLAGTDSDTVTIISELYLKAHPTLTVDGVADKLHEGLTTIKRKRSAFIETLADELGV